VSDFASNQKWSQKLTAFSSAIRPKLTKI
jgi:hypothetical protein